MHYNVRLSKEEIHAHPTIFDMPFLPRRKRSQRWWARTYSPEFKYLPHNSYSASNPFGASANEHFRSFCYVTAMASCWGDGVQAARCWLSNSSLGSTDQSLFQSLGHWGRQRRFPHRQSAGNTRVITKRTVFPVAVGGDPPLRVSK